MPEETEDKCMTPDCGRKVAFKGICRSCYGQALRLIEQNKTDWEQLEKLGLVKLEHKPFIKAFVSKTQTKTE